MAFPQKHSLTKSTFLHSLNQFQYKNLGNLLFLLVTYVNLATLTILLCKSGLIGAIQEPLERTFLERYFLSHGTVG